MAYNLEIVQKAFNAYLESDFNTVLEYLSEDIIWVEPGTDPIPFSGVYKGKKEVKRLFNLQKKVLKIKTFEAIHFIASGNLVAVKGRTEATVKSTGKDYITEWAIHVTAEHDHILEVKAFKDTQTLAAAFV